MLETKIKNSSGEPIVLNELEAKLSIGHQRQLNALGWDIDITSMTAIVKKISEQKFYQIAPADYIPVVVGEGAWSDQLTTYRSFDIGGSFESGFINLAVGNARLASADAGVDSGLLRTTARDRPDWQ
jgi:hypothetical protein